MKNLKFIIMISVSVIIFMIFQLMRPKEIDWTESYSMDKKIPYGDFILHSFLPDIFPDSKITTSEAEPYRTLHYETYDSTNYIFINRDFNPDKFDVNELLDFVKRGNNIFVSAFSYPGKFADTLKLSMNLTFNDSGDAKCRLTALTGRRAGYFTFKKMFYNYYFEEYDTANTKFLGFTGKNHPNFIVTRFGKGKIYLHSNPLIFTNYNVLDTANNQYIFAALSHLPAQNVLWDEHFKSGKIFVTTPLRYILSNDALRWSYYIAIFTIILFMYFKGKRRQRLIPVVKPPENTTIKFIETISNLYYQKKSHKIIADKKILHFFEFLRSNFYIDTNLPDKQLIPALSKKTGVDEEDVSDLLNSIHFIQKRISITVGELYKFNMKLEEFIKKIKD